MEIQVTDTTFKKEVLDSEMPVLVDFWAPWCGPCRMMNPIMEEVAKEMEGKLKIAKMNVDENSETPSQYGVMSIPMMLIMKKGKVLEQMIGAMPKAALLEKIKQAIG